MLRVFLLASLLVVAFADHHDDDQDVDHDDHHHVDDHYGCCSKEDRRDVQQMWRSMWSSSFTDSKVVISREMFKVLVALRLDFSVSSSSSSSFIITVIIIDFVFTIHVRVTRTVIWLTNEQPMGLCKNPVQQQSQFLVEVSGNRVYTVSQKRL